MHQQHSNNTPGSSDRKAYCEAMPNQNLSHSAFDSIWHQRKWKRRRRTACPKQHLSHTIGLVFCILLSLTESALSIEITDSHRAEVEPSTSPSSIVGISPASESEETNPESIRIPEAEIELTNKVSPVIEDPAKPIYDYAPYGDYSDLGSGLYDYSAEGIDYTQYYEGRPEAPQATETREPTPKTVLDVEKAQEDILQPVDPNDKTLEEVFPGFASKYKSTMDEEAKALESLSFVDSADFTVMGEQGEIEKFGNINELAQTIQGLSTADDRMDEDDTPTSAHSEILSTLADGGGTTTLMLFNIFTPDEVDFLADLVSEDVVKELKDEIVQKTSKESNDEDSDEETLHVRESLQAYTHHHANTPLKPYQPKMYKGKNGEPSSQEAESLLATSTGAPLENLSSLEEEGDYAMTSRPEISYSYSLRAQDRTPGPEGVNGLIEDQDKPLNVRPPILKVEQRKVDVKNLLDTLSKKYNHRIKKPVTSASIEDVKKEEKETDKIKDMIDRLKKTIETTRPGVNRLTLDDIYEVQPHTFSSTKYERTTTAKSIPLKSVKSMIGDKIKSMGGGIHRLELDDVLDLDIIEVMDDRQNNKQDSDSADSHHEMTSIPGPQGPPGSKNLPKRQIVHPKLMYKRPNSEIIHRPSINLKSIITPIPDLGAAETHTARSIIPRYTDAYIPRKPSSNYHKNSYMSRFSQGRRPSMSTPDPYPETKELPPYHSPTSGHFIPTTESPSNQYMSSTPSPYNSQSTTGNPYYYASTTFNPEYQDPNYSATPKYVLASSVRQGKKHAVTTADSTQFPPPSSGYKQPSLNFHHQSTKEGEISVTPKNVPQTTSDAYKTPSQDYLPPDRPGLLDSTPRPRVTSPSTSQLPETVKTYHPPRGYLPPDVRNQPSSKPESGMYLPPDPDYVHPKSSMKEMHAPKRAYEAPQKSMQSYQAPHKGYLPPYKDMESYQPPQKEYLPPHKDMESYQPPNQGYLAPQDDMESYQPPKKEYLPPHKDIESYQPPNQGYLPPNKDMESYQPPNQGYLPPTKDMKSYKPPGKEYLPPQKAMESYQPPKNEYLPPQKDMESYQPPNQDYLPPLDDMESYQLPKKEYLPPHKDMKSYQPPNQVYIPPHKDMESYQPPQKDYLPPHKDMESYQPPNQGYLPPHEDMESYQPPQKGYLPPHKDMKSYQPPNQGYTPPHEGMESYQPPKKDYLPPHKDMESYQPPNKGYIPPHEDMESYQPPQKGYLPPHKDMKSYQPPNQGYIPPHKDMESYQAPQKEYLPPHKDMESYQPPSQGYLPPHDYMESYQPPNQGYLPPTKDMKSYKPPGKEYLPPHKDMESYQPPQKEYLPPHKDMETYQPPNQGYLPPHEDSHSEEVTQYQLPNENYSPPHKDMQQYNTPNKNYLPPVKYMNSYQAPTKEYLPPHEDMEHLNPPQKHYLPPNQLDPNLVGMQQYIPPSKKYLPPFKDMKHMNPPARDYEMPHSNIENLQPPRKGYLPPKRDEVDVNHEGMTKYHPPSKGYLPPQKEMSHYSAPQHKYSPPHKDMGKYVPPSKDYIQPHEDVTQYSPPRKQYLPPHKEMKHMTPPTLDYLEPELGVEVLSVPSKSYLPPKHNLKSGIEHISLPQKAYLPPQEDISHMRPPNSDYGVPHDEMRHMYPPANEYLQPQMRPNHMRPPSKDYLPPHEDMKHILPPHNSYLPPKGSMDHMHPPSKGYSMPSESMKGLHPPFKNYLPPDKSDLTKYSASHHEGIKDFVPPSKGYLPPHGAMTAMIPPNQGYNLPLHDATHYKPPSHQYLSPDHDIEHIKPPFKGYLPPKSQPNPNSNNYVTPHPDMAHMQTPTHDYKAPKHTQMQHPSNEYNLPQSDVKHMHPPKQNYFAPHRTTPLSPAHFVSCPNISPKSGKMCEGHTKDTCSDHGTRDKLCPYSGLCCSDGCAHVCLPPDYGALQHNATTKALPIPTTYAPKNHKSATKNFCPEVNKRESCEHPHHQCWSPGVPDLDCPGSGLCCYDGCSNVCINGYHQIENSYHVHHHHHVSYHVPPNDKYLVPASQFIPHHVLHGPNPKGLSVTQLLEQYLGNQSKGKVDAPDHKPPTYGMENVYPLKELENMDIGDYQQSHGYQPSNGHGQAHSKFKSVMLSPPTEYKPPALSYLPPTDQHHTLPSLDHLNHESLFTSPRSPPISSYLPPRAHPDLGEDYEHMTHYSLPNKGYLAPKSPKSLEGHPHRQYLPPSHDFLTPQDGHTHKPQGYSTIMRFQEFQPPSKTYLPPSAGSLITKISVNDLKEPSRTYLPPDNHRNGANHITKEQDVKHKSPKTNQPHYVEKKGAEYAHFETPSKDYLPPKSSKEPFDESNSKAKHHEADGLDDHYKPPSKQYLPPGRTTKDNVEHQHYQPPSKSYLPPQNEAHELDHIEPPSQQYLPPKRNSPNKIGPGYQHPSKDYLLPEVEHGVEDHFNPPSKDYLPPHSASALPDNPAPGSHFHPPTKAYLPPTSPKEDPAHSDPSVHYQAPQKSYIPPPLADLGSTYQAPSNEYLPPKAESQHPPDHYQPPSKTYIPPHDKPSTLSDQYRPPSKSYLPPNGPKLQMESKYQSKGHATPHYDPPSKEYLPPKHAQSDIHLDEIDTPSSDYLAPVGKGNNLANTYSPPSKDYLPPVKEEHGNKDREHNYGLHPPSKGYLPPKLESQPITIHPPTKDYLPPHSSAHGTSVTTTPIHITVSEQYRASSPGTTSPYHVPPTPVPHVQGNSNEPNILINGKSYKLDLPLEARSPTAAALPPHSINIQINIPNKDEFTIGNGIRGLGGNDLHHSPGMEDKNYVPKIPEYIPGSPAVLYPDSEDSGHRYNKPTYYGEDHHLDYETNPYGFNLPKPQYHKTKDHPPRKYISTKDHLRNYQPQYVPTVPKKGPTYPNYRPPSPFPSSHTDGQHLFGYESEGLYLPSDKYLAPNGNIVPPNLLPHLNSAPKYNAPHELPPKLPKYLSHEDSKAHGVQPTTTHPSESYLPPSQPTSYIPPPLNGPSEGYIPPPPDAPLTPDYLAPPKKEYLPPPPRPSVPEVNEEIPEPPSPDEVAAQQVLNSQSLPPSSASDHYIPPKTKHDIPKNFMRPEDAEDILEPPEPAELLPELEPESENISEPPVPFLGLAKLINETDNEPKLPPMPTMAPPQPDSFLPLLEGLSPDLLKRLRLNANKAKNNAAQQSFIPGVPGKDYPDFKSIPNTAFSCENFILEGFYADTFTSCQTFHVCESGKRQSSFLCPRGTIFNQKHRVCDWWYNVKCEDSAEFYDLNLDLILLEEKKNRANLNIPPPIDPFGVTGVDSNVLSGLASDSSLLGGFGAQLLNSLGMMNVMNGIDRSDNFVPPPKASDENFKIRNRPTPTTTTTTTTTLPPKTLSKKDKSFIHTISDLEQNDVNDMTSDELSKLANSLATLEQLAKDLEHFDDDELSEMLQNKGSPPSRLPLNKFLPRSGQPAIGSRRSDEGSQREKISSSLCELMNICENPSHALETPRNFPADPTAFSKHSKIVNPVPESSTRLASLNNPNIRTGEKTASEVAQLIAQTRQQLKLQALKDSGDQETAASELLLRSPKRIDSDSKFGAKSDFHLSEDNIDSDATSWKPTTKQAFTESNTESTTGWKPIRNPANSLN